MERSKWLTAQEFGDYIGKSKRTVWRLLEEGLPFTKIGGSRMIHQDVGDDWLIDRMTISNGGRPVGAEHHAKRILDEWREK